MPLVDYEEIASDFGATPADSQSVSIPREAPGAPGQDQLAFQNNNPGNIRYVGQENAQPGANGFAKFNTPEDGYNEIRSLIVKHAQAGHDLGTYLTAYAPPKENDTETYISNAEKSIGVPRTTKVSDINPEKIAAFQAHQESGSSVGPDYSAIAKQFGATEAPQQDGTDYSAIAKQFGATEAEPEKQPDTKATDDKITASKAWDIAKQTFTTPFSQALSNVLGKYGPGKVTSLQEHYDNVIKAMEDSSIGKDAKGIFTSDGRNASADWLLSAANSIGRGVAGSMDFLTTPLGQATIAAPGAAEAISPGAGPLVGRVAGATYASTQAPAAIQKAGEFVQNPSKETFGPAVEAVAGAVAPVAGMMAGELSRANPIEALDRHNAEAARLLEQERNKPSYNPEVAQSILGTADIPIDIDDSVHHIKPAGVSASGRPFYEVTDADGKTVFGGYAEAVKGWLAQQKAYPVVESKGVTQPKAGDTFERENGNFKVTDITKDRVSYEKTTPTGQVIKGKLSLGTFTKMVSSSPEKKAGDVGSSEAGDEHKNTGSVDINLTEDGKKQAEEIADKVTAPNVDVVTSDNTRALETGKAIDEDAKPEEWANPQRMGATEGLPSEDTKEQKQDLIDNPDKSPGVSPITGVEGESNNQFRERFLGGLRDDLSKVSPDDTKIYTVSGSNLNMVRAWIANGDPDDLKVDESKLAKSYNDAPGSMFLAEDGELKPVTKIDGPGVYFVHHAETPFNPIKSEAPAETKNYSPEELEPQTKSESVRLYRGQSEKEYSPSVDTKDAGRWFTSDLDQAQQYGKKVLSVDIPKDQYEQLLRDEEEMSRTAPGSNPLRGKGGVLLPAEDANRAEQVPAALPTPPKPEPQDVAQEAAQAPVAAGVDEILSSAKRPVKIGGETFIDQDPRAELIQNTLTPDQKEQVDALMKSEGADNPKFLAGGFDHVVIDLGNDKVLKLGKLPKEQPETPFSLKPTASKTIGNVGVEVYPKLDTKGITEDDVQHVVSELAKQDLTWNDPGTDNLGRDADGNLKILDGEVTERPAKETKEPEPVDYAAAAKEFGGVEAPKEETKEEAPAEEPEHKYSSTQVNIPDDLAQRVRDFAKKQVPDEKLAEEGREDEPHITVLYGLHGTDAAPALELLKGEGPVTAKIGTLSLFSNPEGDVLKLSVNSPELAALNKKLSALPNSNEYPEYQPHITVAYLKPGEGKKYVGRPLPGLTGKTLTFDKVVYSPSEGDRTEIGLEKEPTIEGEKQNDELNATAGENPAALAEVPSKDVSGTPAERETGAEHQERGPVDQGSDRGVSREGNEPGPSTGSDERAVGVPTSGERRALEHTPTSTDYRITESDHVGEGSIRQKANDNLAAIRTLKQIESEGRPATPEEQKILVKYVGWGGMPQAFQQWGVPREWQGVSEDLKGLLTDKEFDSARASTPNAHYTSPMVIDAMWKAASQIGAVSEQGNRVDILEPSMGVGHFFGLQPGDLSRMARTGIELDTITGRIAKLLYPESDIHVGGFEAVRLPSDYFDLAISNVPFGNYGVHDPAFKRTPGVTKSIHDYFFAKALDKVRPGGAVAFITSNYTMDKRDPFIRKYLAGRADLIGAIRLPNSAFKGNAGTEVTTDIIFLKKRSPQEPVGGESWSGTESIETPDGPTEVNEYFARHPEMMLGKSGLQGTMYRDRSYALTGELTPEKLQEAVANSPKTLSSNGKLHRTSTRPHPLFQKQGTLKKVPTQSRTELLLFATDTR